ncbi:MAG: magnesium transporter CorA family protein [Candidatus Cloacimonetes bacterium]|nr:magnesium transporter CorA family protein [Candidatus Cloacimonadota bacterium]
MINAYLSSGTKFTPTANLDEAFWIHLDVPDTTEIQQVITKYELPEDFITDLQDADENSRLEYEDGAILIIMRVPVFYKHRTSKLPFATVPLGLIILTNKIISVSFFDQEILTTFQEGKHRPFNITPQSFILNINLRTSIYYLRFLKEINRRTNNIEQELHVSMKNKELIRLLRLEKSLVYFTTSLKANELILERIQRSRWLQSDPEGEDMIDDVIIENKQAIDMANIYSDILSGMMDAFASVISNNLNIVMKFLTTITIIIAIPTMIFSMYGMNVHLPLEKSPWAFVFIAGFSLVAALITIIIFIRKKYF